MSDVLKVVAFDPALSNLGIATMDYLIDEDRLELKSLKLVQTEATKHKTVRKNSDDLQRARLLYSAIRSMCFGQDCAIAEIPTGTQSARGAMSNGIAIGVLAACPLPLIEVSPREAKLASIGIATATKIEMIEWAMEKYPHKDWKMRTVKGVLRPTMDNEHLADACAIAEAGVKTAEFKQALALFKSARGKLLAASE